MRLRVVLEYDEQARSFAAYCPELPGCASCGDTEGEAIENIREAIELYLEPDDLAVENTSKVVEITVISTIAGVHSK